MRCDSRTMWAGMKGVPRNGFKDGLMASRSELNVKSFQSVNMNEIKPFFVSRALPTPEHAGYRKSFRIRQSRLFSLFLRSGIHSECCVHVFGAFFRMNTL